jgi:hypothetical protein
MRAASTATRWRGRDRSKAQCLAFEGERAAAVDALGILAHAGLVDLVAEVRAGFAAQESAVKLLAAVDVGHGEAHVGEPARQNNARGVG